MGLTIGGTTLTHYRETSAFNREILNAVVSVAEKYDCAEQVANYRRDTHEREQADVEVRRIMNKYKVE